MKKTKLKLISLALITFTCGFMLIYKSNELKIAVLNGIDTGLNIIIPSLFAFMVLSAFIIESSIYRAISKPFRFVAVKIFNMDVSLFIIFILSNIGGYPVGAKLIYELYHEGVLDKKTAENMLCYCFCSGPSFIVGVVALKLYNRVDVGILIWVSIVMSNVFTAYFINRKSPCLSKCVYKEYNISSNALIKSINSASKSLYIVCAVIIFFNIIIELLSQFGIIDIISSLFNFIGFDSKSSMVIVKSIFEISNLSHFDIGKVNLIPVITALLSFGGLCVFMQVGGIVNSRLSMVKFLVLRVITSFSSGIISYFITRNMQIAIQSGTLYTPSDTDSLVSVISLKPVLSLVLFAMTVILLKSATELKHK